MLTGQWKFVNFPDFLLFYLTNDYWGCDCHIWWPARDTDHIIPTSRLVTVIIPLWTRLQCRWSRLHTVSLLGATTGFSELVFTLTSSVTPTSASMAGSFGVSLVFKAVEASSDEAAAQQRRLDWPCTRAVVCMPRIFHQCVYAWMCAMMLNAAADKKYIRKNVTKLLTRVGLLPFTTTDEVCLTVS